MTDDVLVQSPEIEAAVADASKRAAFALESCRGVGYRDRWRALTGAVAAGGDAEGLGPVTREVAALEGVGRAGAGAGLTYALTSQRFGVQAPLRSILTPGQWRALGDVEGGAALLCHALTEEGGGSDPLSMATRAEPLDDGGYVLTGRKAYVTAAPVADTALVFARTSEGGHPFVLTPFLVDLSAPGVSRSEPFAKTALVEVPMGALDFDRVRLGPRTLVGREGAGLAVLNATTAWERALLPAYALGPMRRVLDRTVEWARTRRHFGRRMGESHLVAARVADMALALMRSRRLVYAMAARLDAGESPAAVGVEAALTKISVAEDHQAFTRWAAMLGGVRSFVEESGLTADLATPMAASVYAGPDDLLRVSVARGLGLPVEN
ncbi:acyl-CoA dehydrogenase [Nocardiopsis exhalans]|uniref:Acyl-CoA dehydrogenase n=1 Tax=Nocardiopsis exhalans TaxID=163604 RepID=A0ABY5DFS4_9ACTN|nr:acyl-CoA dehydrogenase [Nocardiopsis exhalans]USY22323.1 acyl-CoA dehydrogenase [Nocardiopsis exhalans]